MICFSMICPLLMWYFSLLTYAGRNHSFVFSYNLSRCGRRSCLQHRKAGMQQRWSAARTWRFFMSLCNWRTSASSTPSMDTSWEKGIDQNCHFSMLEQMYLMSFLSSVVGSCYYFLFSNSCFTCWLILCFSEHDGTRWRWLGLCVSLVPTSSHRPESSLSRSGQALTSNP